MAIQATSCCNIPFVQLTLNALNAFTLFDLFEDALAEMLCLRTYSHGTAPHSYYSIISRGADPAYGGRADKGEGASNRLHGAPYENTGNFDSRDKIYVIPDDNLTGFSLEYLGNFAGLSRNRMATHAYATGTTSGELFGSCAAGNCILLTIAETFSFILTFLSPILKFRFTREESDVMQFQEDPTFSLAPAAYTKHSISPDHIGLYGTIVHGFSGDLYGRIQAEPERFMCGLLKLIILVVLAALVYIGAVFSLEFAVVVITLLCIETALFVGRVAVPLILGLAMAEPAPAPAHAQLA